MIEKTYNVGIYCRLSNDDERDAVKQEVIHPDYIIPRLTAHVKDVDGDCYSGIAIRNVPFSRPVGATENDAQKLHARTQIKKGCAADA